MLGEIQSHNQAFQMKAAKAQLVYQKGWRSTGLAWPVTSPWVSVLTSVNVL